MSSPLIPPEAAAAAEDAVILVYDTNRMPVSYDFCWVMAWADLKRQHAGMSKLHVHIIDIDETWTHARPVGHPDHIGREELQWRIRTMLWPMAEMVAATSSIAVWPSGTCADFGGIRENQACSDILSIPDLKTIYHEVLELATDDTKLSGFHAPAALRQQMDKLRGDSKKQLVTVTLRQNRGGSARNSNLQAWRSFINKLPHDFVQPVVVPDTENWSEDLGGRAKMVPAAAFDMYVRMALYEAASMNLFVNNGPASLCVLTPDCPYLMFKIVVPGEKTASLENMQALGFEVGETPKFSGPRQRWVWEDDGTETICCEYEKLIVGGLG